MNQKITMRASFNKTQRNKPILNFDKNSMSDANDVFNATGIPNNIESKIKDVTTSSLPIHATVISGNQSGIVSLLNSGAEINSLDENGQAQYIWHASLIVRELRTFFSSTAQTLTQKTEEGLRLFIMRRQTIVPGLPRYSCGTVRTCISVICFTVRRSIRRYRAQAMTFYVWSLNMLTLRTHFSSHCYTQLFATIILMPCACC